jgi:ribosomal-protein-alanine N-acetyltransferase
MAFEILETERLYLRKLTDELYEGILSNATDEDIALYLNVALKDVGKEKEKARKGFATYNKSLLIFQLIDKETHAIIGWCGFHTWYKDHCRAEIGYALTHEASRNKGIMYEAMRSILDYGFKKMNLVRIEAFIGLDNAPSLKLVQKFGFMKEGQLRNHYFINGQFEDSVVYGLLLEDFVA